MFSMNKNYEFQSFADEEHSSTTINTEVSSRIMPPVETAALTLLIVDDDEAVHIVTRYAMKEFTFNGSAVQILSAYSAAEAKNVLLANPDVAVVLLDVVMDGRDAGLRLVEYIRNELKNRFVRIILRTGQPGEAPEYEVIHSFDINDYRSKTELNDVRLMTVLTTALRTFVDMMELEKFRQNLEVLVEERTHDLEETNAALQKANELLNTTNAELNDANAFKTQMLSIVAHDLKNPISAVTGFSDIGLIELSSNTTDIALVRHSLESINQTSTSMMKLVMDLLDTAALELATITLTSDTFFLSSLVTGVVDNFGVSAQKKKQTIHLESHDSILIAGDPHRLKQVFENLLSNALKYSPPEANIHVRICKPYLAEIQSSDQMPRVESSPQMLVRVEFQDEGPGVGEEDKAKMFQFFQRLSAVPTNGESSHGVGLALVKKILTMHNGNVRVESRKDEGIPGSTFVVELPVAEYR